MIQPLSTLKLTTDVEEGNLTDVQLAYVCEIEPQFLKKPWMLILLFQ